MEKPGRIPRHHSKRWQDQLDEHRASKGGGLNGWAGVHAIVVVGAGITGYALPSISAPSSLFAMVSPSCRIKGNVSINSGERIFHVPAQDRYDETVISPRYGERWFCSEAEARQAGWRKAHR